MLRSSLVEVHREFVHNIVEAVDREEEKQDDRREDRQQGEDSGEVVNTKPPVQQNFLKIGYDENKGYGESFENKCATNYSIITNNNWNNTHNKHNKQLTMPRKYTNDDVDFDDCVVHIMH